MPKVKKGKNAKNGRKSKTKQKVKVSAKDEVKLPAPMIDIKVKFDPDDQTFTYRDAEKVMEADNDATDCTMDLNEYVRSIRPEVIEDIKPKIEPVVKQEKAMEADNDATDCGMELSEYEVMEDIKLEIEPVVKQEPYDPDFDGCPEFIGAHSIDDVVVEKEKLHDPPRKKQPNIIGHRKKKMFKWLPDELVEQFGPGYCELCDAKLKCSSTVRSHYESKKHESKISWWLYKWTRKTGMPMPKRYHVNENAPRGPNAIPCSVCKKTYTSLEHAKQHREKHRIAVAKKNKLNGVVDGSIEIGESNRFNIGEAFLPKKAIDVKLATSSSHKTFLRCEVCQINLQSESARQSHLSGKKHAKNCNNLLIIENCRLKSPEQLN